MTSSVTNEQPHFLSDEQKAVKQKIMEQMMQAFFNNMNENLLLFTPQSALDLTFSILVMFNRDILVHLINSYQIERDRKEIMKQLFDTIKDEVNKRIKSKLN
jgi:FKBP-type peptidyl-prolyl cis-trans isomerase (trigger factor)